MDNMLSILKASRTQALIEVDDRARARAAELAKQAWGGEPCEKSVCASRGCLLLLMREGREKFLTVLSDRTIENEFSEDTRSAQIEGLEILTIPAGAAAVEYIQNLTGAFKPTCVGLERSFGFGDRLGVATPGHVRALGGRSIRPFFAQQSIRELSRSGRSPRDVIRDAALGLFQEGYTQPFGSDADHLKNTTDIDWCVEAGFTLFTFDPGDFVDDGADRDGPAALVEKSKSLPWAELETGLDELRRRYSGRSFEISDGVTLDFNEERLLRAVVKYGAAVAHVRRLYGHLKAKMGAKPFEVEVSVDETNSPTTPQEHFFVTSELTRPHPF